ncbi:MAG: c-type cytochrome [Bacteroidales bacterium]
MGQNLRCGRLFLLIFFAFLHNYSLLNAQNGESSYNKICAACHTIGKGKLIGPDLKDVSKRRNPEWLVNFIRSSQDVIKSNDSYAIALFEEYNKIPMPDVNLSDAEIKQLISYIDEQSTKVITGAESKTDSIELVNGNIESGRSLFIGERRFKNGGSACISCHTIDDSDVLYGGKLAKNLTASYGVLKSAGIGSVLKSLTFPAMTNTYGNKNLTDTEISDLTAYLKHTGENKYIGVSQSFDQMFFLFGLLFFIALLYFFHIFWKNKKPDSVKEHIYSR